MFFSTYVLTKKGPLAKIWLAAHWDKKLTRCEVKVIDLSQTILHIVQPVVPIALRTSGELLVGVVRIYALKVRNLLKDATDATLYLRVTTLQPQKGSTSGGGPAGHPQADGSTPSKPKHIIEGVLVGQAHGGVDDAEGVSFEWRKGVNDGHIAEALDNARFDAIADLLEGSAAHTHALPHAASAKAADGAVTNQLLSSTWWYAAEPNSQLTEEQRNTQQDFDDIARMRADLLAFGERAVSDANSNSKKSSLSSIEKARASGLLSPGGGVVSLGDGQHLPQAVRVGATGVLPAIPDEFDIGVPLPDGPLPPLFGDAAKHTVGALGEDGPGAVDPFALPELVMLPEEGLQPSTEAAIGAAGLPRRPRPSANVVDAVATTLTREAVEKSLRDRADILHAEPRRGPFDLQETMDRFTIAGEAPTRGPGAAPVPGLPSAMLDAQPLSHMPSAAMRSLFASMVQEATHAAARELAQNTTAARGGAASGARSGPPLADSLAEEGVGFDWQQLPLADTETLRNPAAAYKRARGDDDDEDDEDGEEDSEAVDGSGARGSRRRPGGLSIATIGTLRSIRAAVERVAGANPKASRKRHRWSAAGSGGSDTVPDAEEQQLTWISTSVPLSSVCAGMSRVEAAQTFVGTMALASKSLLTARQDGWLEDITVQLTAASNGITVAVAGPIPPAVRAH